MSAGRLPLFCDIALAARIERVEAQLIAKASEAARRRRADGAGFVIPIAVVTTQPGSKSQQNVQRRGFDLLYTRAVLVKQPVR